MVSISQIQNGFALFVDREIAVAFDGWQKVVVAGFGGLLAANLQSILTAYSNSPIVAAIGVYDANSNSVNIDALYQAFVPKLGTEKIPINIPKIGVIKFGREEIESLVRYIKES